MKRTLAWLLAALLLLPLFTACGTGRLTPAVTAPQTEEARETEKTEETNSAADPAPAQTRDYEMKDYPLSEISDKIRLLGERTNVTDAGLILEWACSGFEMDFATEGTDIVLHFNTTYGTFFKAYLDGVESAYRLAISGNAARTAFKNVPAGNHTLRLVKDGQPDKNGGSCTLVSLSLDGEITFAPVEKSPLYLEFIGDSIWTGVGALGNRGSSPEYSSEISATVATPYRTASALGADYNITARGSIGVVKDAGGLVASQLFLRQNGYRDELPYEPKCSPDAVILCLGANDPASQREEFIEQGVALVRLIRATYGDGTKVVWTNGMFSKTRFISEIGTIVERCGGEAAGVYYLQMIYGQNGSGSGENNRHPSLSDHEKNAAVLIPFLREILALD